MSNLSPAALSIWDAFNQFDHAGMHVNYNIKLAAALRAVADQLGESRAPGLEPENLYGRIVDVDDLLAIAIELEHCNRSN